MIHAWNHIPSLQRLSDIVSGRSLDPLWWLDTLTERLAQEPSQACAVSPVPPQPPKQMSIPPIDLLPHIGHVHNLVVPGTMPDKGKRPDRGTRRSREDSPGAESGRKKKLLKRVSIAVITDTEDEDRQPTGTIIVKARFPLIIFDRLLTSP